ncbi:MAG: SPASM domain-containing protein, partial [Clostridium sp.]
INISLHSFEANTNNIDFNDYVESIISFIKEGVKSTKTIYALRLWNEDGIKTKGENELNELILKMLQERFALNFDLREKFVKDKRVKIIDRVYLNAGEKFEWPTLNREEISDSGFCYGLRDQFGILVDGTVVPCCLDGEGKIPLGNIYETALKDILEGERAVKIYDGFTNRKKVEELCRKCGYSEMFGK